MKPTVYFAAPLFKGGDVFLNSGVIERLENKGYEIKAPQRDGFEVGNLSKVLKERIESDELELAAETIIYLLDMGKFIPESDVILANLDDPMDEGVITEVTYANILGKFVLGWRTDTRSPYGKPNSSLKGMHSFPAYQFDEILFHTLTCETPEVRERQLDKLVKKMDKAIQQVGTREIPEHIYSNAYISSIINGAKILFKDLDDIHSKKGLNRVVSRYIKHKDRIEKIFPKIH